MIDFHSHFLPYIDDGAKDINESLEMLSISKKSGVDTIVSTSHCYAFSGNRDIKHFLEKRNSAYSKVLNSIGSDNEAYPNIILGCEVHLVPKLSTFPDLPLLCIGNTNYVLLEMPSSDWKDEDFEEIYQITKLGLKPVIAHIDRYFNMEEQFPDLFSLNLLFQANAESFFSRDTRRKLYELIKKDALHIIGSDMHNINSRPPNVAEAYALIENKFGKIYAGYLDFASHKILENKTVPAPRVPKLSLIKKLTL